MSMKQDAVVMGGAPSPCPRPHCVGDAAEDATPPVEAAAEQDRAQAALDTESKGHEPEPPDDEAIPVPPSIADDPAAATVREITARARDLEMTLRSARRTPTQMADSFGEELRLGSSHATAAEAEAKRRAWASPAGDADAPLAVALHCCGGAANTLEDGAREQESDLAEIDANRRLSDEARVEDREKLRAENREKYGRTAEALFEKGKKTIHVAEEKVRLKLEQLTDVAEPTPGDEAREGIDAMLYLAAAGGGQDDERMDRLIHSVVFHNPRLAARLLGVFAATARDPLRLESCVHSLEGRVSALQRTDILLDERRRALAADLYLLGRARRAVDQIQEQANHRPEEISLLRQAIDRLFADLRR